LYFSSAQIWEQFIPLCFQLLEVGAAPVRAAAAAAAASLMRHNKRAAQRADIAQRLVRDFAEGASAAQRILFLDFCAAVRKVASTRLFRDYFLHAAVDLLMVRNGRSRVLVFSGPSGTLSLSPVKVSFPCGKLGAERFRGPFLAWCCRPPSDEDLRTLESRFLSTFSLPCEASCVAIPDASEGVLKPPENSLVIQAIVLNPEGLNILRSTRAADYVKVLSDPGFSSGLLDDKEVREGPQRVDGPQPVLQIM
jgi:hypothetical protein